jgi:catechol 2,3-dioxygenase-like lactoylglutathione lyase family enzyme
VIEVDRTGVAMGDDALPHADTIDLPGETSLAGGAAVGEVGRMSISLSHDHVGISLTPEDLDATIEWYSRMLGFTVDRRFDSPGMTFVFLVHGDVKIELMAVASVRQEPIDDILSSMAPARLHHFCLAVTDLDAVVTELRDLGVRLLGGPMTIEELGQRIAFISDNLGNIIELAEPGTRPPGARPN